MAALTGKVAIVTASSRGIGRAIAQRLSKNGDRLSYELYGQRIAEAAQRLKH
jgi:3-oxoacyl-[acyl-carrier protein] reductase